MNIKMLLLMGVLLASNTLVFSEDLPAGSYRDSCMSCSVRTDSKGKKVLGCMCPMKWRNEMQKKSNTTLNVSSACTKDIQNCNGTLRCGACSWWD